MKLSTESLACSLFLLVSCMFRPAAGLSCIQQSYTPGQPFFGFTTENLPRITCPGASTSCFKMVCFGSTYYVVRGCLDFTRPEFNCQTLSTQCPGALGQCYTCDRNNCNAAVSLTSNPAKLVGLLLALPLAFRVVFGKN